MTLGDATIGVPWGFVSGWLTLVEGVLSVGPTHGQARFMEIEPPARQQSTY